MLPRRLTATALLAALLLTATPALAVGFGHARATTLDRIAGWVDDTAHSLTGWIAQLLLRFTNQGRAEVTGNGARAEVTGNGARAEVTGNG